MVSVDTLSLTEVASVGWGCSPQAEGEQGEPHRLSESSFNIQCGHSSGPVNRTGDRSFRE